MTQQEEDETSPEWNSDPPTYRSGIDTRHRVRDEPRIAQKASAIAKVRAEWRAFMQQRVDRIYGALKLGGTPTVAIGLPRL